MTHTAAVRPTRVPNWEKNDGTPRPLGVTWLEHEQAYNFALYGGNASKVTLQLYLKDELRVPHLSVTFDPLKNKSGPIWHCRVPMRAAGDAEYYAYQVDGPVDGAALPWHAFDPKKVLLDPYSRSIFFPESFSREAARSSGSNAGRAPLGRLDVCRCPFDWRDEQRIRHGSDLVIYEMHVRGFTRHPTSDLADCDRGTFAGIVQKLPYLKELGVTAVELMPVFQFDPADGNYWGYMPLSFFAPHHAYSKDQSSCEQHSQFREMVRELHAAGIEVILDVVYNHTCEGDHQGPTYSYRGIDSATYYIETGNRESPYANFSGTGNTLDTSNPAVRRLILDSLRYWAKEMHVDGFRFDLASVFSRTSDGKVDLSQPPLFDQIASDPELAHVRLIAEPWDASGLYQLGAAFPGRTWMQWNGRFRDSLQRFVRGDRGQIPELMTRIYGSSDLFPDDVFHAFRPFQSVNYLSSHDGFTMADLVSYSEKHNAANGQDNRDGPNEFSCNSGWEGDQDAPQEVLDLRKRQVKNFCCLLMLSAGTPMFRMGDEFLQTQGGNNNPFNQDNETSWLDWRRLEQNQEVFRFFKRMIAFRKSHPSLGRSTFWRDDIRWFGSELPEVNLSAESRLLAYHLRADSPSGRDLYVMINGSSAQQTFNLHTGAADGWLRAIDTSLPSPLDIAGPGKRVPLQASAYRVSPRSIVVLEYAGLATHNSR
ncbi:MAG: glycogen-debranching protein [Planctomycetales bacterium]|nr:glycogen-debranching protein [Planctomycetales bacterium]